MDFSSRASTVSEFFFFIEKSLVPLLKEKNSTLFKLESSKLKNNLKSGKLVALAVFTNGFSGRGIVNIIKASLLVESDADSLKESYNVYFCWSCKWYEKSLKAIN